MNTEESAAQLDEGAIGENRGTEYLLVDVAQRRAAVLLSDVLRIEQVPFSRIEYVGVRPVLNFDGQLLPVEDAGGVLQEAHGERQVIIVVCRDGDRQVGVAVTNVLDVAAGSDLFEAGSTQTAAGVTLLKDRVTSIVDLGGVAPLEMNSQAPESWNEYGQVYVENAS
jgi:two-component system chemotaxis sensor kinase CheA